MTIYKDTVYCEYTYEMGPGWEFVFEVEAEIEHEFYKGSFSHNAACPDDYYGVDDFSIESVKINKVTLYKEGEEPRVVAKNIGPDMIRQSVLEEIYDAIKETYREV